MDDLISRQAAIDALDSQLDYLSKLDARDNPGIENKWYGVNWSKNTIAELPSAQPDRSLWFHIGELCVDESKGNITAEVAIEKIRALLRAERREE